MSKSKQLLLQLGGLPLEVVESPLEAVESLNDLDGFPVANFRRSEHNGLFRDSKSNSTSSRSNSTASRSNPPSCRSNSPTATSVSVGREKGCICVYVYNKFGNSAILIYHSH